MKRMVAVELDDDRLKGWKRDGEFRIEMAPGERVEIVDIHEDSSGELFDAAKSLTVWLAIVAKDGSRDALTLPMVFRPAEDKRLTTLERFEAALSDVIKEAPSNFWAWRHDAAADPKSEHGGRLEPPAIDQAFRMVAGLEHALAELAPGMVVDLVQRLRNLFANAYSAGHLVATWELKEEFEAAAQAGLRIPGQKTPGGLARGGKRSSPPKRGRSPQRNGPPVFRKLSRSKNSRCPIQRSRRK